MNRGLLPKIAATLGLALLPLAVGGPDSPSHLPAPELRAMSAAEAPTVRAGAAEFTPPGTAPASDAATAPTGTERTGAARLRSLRRNLDAVVPTERWPGSSWGVLVTSLDRGDTLYAVNAHRALAPASNVKLLTTAAALHHLGPDHRYRTFLLTDAPLEDGVLRGDLAVYGTGDPTLSGSTRSSASDPFAELARRLRQRGVRKVEGDVVGDGSYFQGPLRPPGWRSRDLNEWFAAPVDALQYNENLAMLRIRPGPTAGREVRVETIPEIAPLSVRVRARTVTRRTGHRVWALRDTPENPVSVIGQIRVQDPDVWRRMPVSDPALYAARGLRAALAEEGIRVKGNARAVQDRRASILPDGPVWAPGLTGDSSGTRVLAEHRSRPLVELLWTVNRRSHNLYAESVLRTLGRVVDGDGTFEGGTRVVRRFLVDEVGVPPSEARPVDGSGLSPQNRVSPYAFVRVLDHMAAGPHWPAFWSTLPQAGNWRELRRMYRSPAAGNLRAKTGTLDRVSALSGVVEARNGERLAFSVVSNEVPSTSIAKAVEDRIGVRLATFSRPFDGEAPTRLRTGAVAADDTDD